MGLWGYSGQERHGVRLFECLVVLFVVGGSFVGVFGNGLDCPSSLFVLNGTHLKIVSRKNQTETEFCGASLETVCVQDPATDACRVLMNLSVNLVVEGDEVVDFGLTLLATSQNIGKWEQIWCNVTDLAKDIRFANKLFTVNWLMDYDCCGEGRSQEIYFSDLSVSYYQSEEPCEATTTVVLKPEINEVNSPVNIIEPRTNDNTSAENFVMLNDDWPVKASSLTGLVAAVSLAVLAAIVTVIVVYIICVKRDGGHCKRRTHRFDPDKTLLGTTTPDDCRHCKFAKVEVVAPGEDFTDCSTTEIDVIPPPTTTSYSSSSLSDPKDDKLDSGWYE